MYGLHNVQTALVGKDGSTLKMLPHARKEAGGSFYQPLTDAEDIAKAERNPYLWTENDFVRRYYSMLNRQYMRSEYGSNLFPDSVRTEEERDTIDGQLDVMKRWAPTQSKRRQWIQRNPGAIDVKTLVFRPPSGGGDGGDEGLISGLQPRWDNVSFSTAAFSEGFMLEGFNPTVHVNLALHDILPAGEEYKGMGNMLNGRKVHGPRLRIRHSGDRLKGNGLFCDDPRGIPSGAFIIPFDGWVVSKRRYQELARGNPRMSATYDLKDAMVVGTDELTGEDILVIASSGNPPDRVLEEGIEVIPEERTHASRFINTVCSNEMANCAVVHWVVDGRDTLWVVNPFTRTIAPGEELLIAYDPVDPLDYFRDIGLYARTPGFIYPPDTIRDDSGKTLVSIQNYDLRNTRMNPSFHIQPSAIKSNAMALNEQEIQLRQF